MPPTSPILVIGAGPSGLVMAAELARHGAACRIVDKSPTPAPESRAVGIHSRSLEVFEDMGVLPAALAEGQKVHGVSIMAGGQRILHLSLDELDAPYPFVLDLPQCDTERILARHMQSLGVSVERPVE